MSSTSEVTTTYPFSRLFLGPTKTVVISGPHIHVLDSSTGETLWSTTKFTEAQTNDAKILKSGPVRCAAIDEAFKYLAEVGEDKVLKVWDVESFKLVNSRELPKKPTSVMFTKDSQTILVSDKFGDVFSYPLIYTPFTPSELTAQKEAASKDPLASHPNPSNGTLVLGHVSPLTAMLLTPDEKYIVTADRDEHIRVSWYPQGYNIESYCLGSLKFVSSIHILPSSPCILISGGGDPVLRVWDWLSGKQLSEIPIQDAVDPYIVVKRIIGKNRWEENGEGGDEEEGSGKKKGKGRKGRKGKGKEAQNVEAVTEDGDEPTEEKEADAMDVDVKEETKPQPQKILAVRRIESIALDSVTYIVFNTIGSTALFCTPYLVSSPPPSTIAALDFGRPVLDFVLVPNEALALVVLDSTWSLEGEVNQNSEIADRVRLVSISNSGELKEVKPTTEEKCGKLLEALNGADTSVAASQKDLKSLDLYADLLSLPKYVEKHDATTSGLLTTTPGTAGSSMPAPAPAAIVPGVIPTSHNKSTLHHVAVGGESTVVDGAAPKRKIGRMKRTQKVLEAAMAGQVAGNEDVADEQEVEGDGKELEEPESKRAKSEASTSES